MPTPRRTQPHSRQFSTVTRKVFNQTVWDSLRSSDRCRGWDKSGFCQAGDLDLMSKNVYLLTNTSFR